ncbi:hypothetical protein SeMB42_g05873 [Synchytrium endobioticum]|uniref:BAR domain-containing protein n=1 Tax=Synchytrium endobioticum TaxID=286115 RepID=A0A507CIS9_9FUNG|nr:hypothetical protein SeLEV6574_g07194 [Synchytrium endobioticum]TPX40781.1 hypothetical protein SeMB42_g05873 [Synchytrium endobioticum]
MSNSIRETEEKARYVQRSVVKTEKNMHELRACLQGYTRNQERLRRKSLKLSTILKGYSECEDKNLKAVMAQLAAKLADLQQFRDMADVRIDCLSTEPLKIYNMICSQLKGQIRLREAAIEKEQRKQTQLDRVMIKESANRTKVSQSQLELAGATNDVQLATAALLADIRRFEETKRTDLRSVLGEFLFTEISYHAKAIELLSEAHNIIHETDLTEDLEDMTFVWANTPMTPTTPRSALSSAVPSYM